MIHTKYLDRVIGLKKLFKELENEIEEFSSFKI